MKEIEEELARQPEVREALVQASGETAKARAQAKDKFWFGTHFLLLGGGALLYFLLGTKFLPPLKIILI